MSKLFRVVLGVSLLALMLWVSRVYNEVYFADSNVKDLLTWYGYGGQKVLQEYVSWLLLIGMVSSTFGMFFYIKTARTLFVLFYLLDVGLSPFYGMSIQTGLDVLFYNIFISGQAVALFAAYFTSVKHQFESSTPT